MVTLVIGGARSGKSRFAHALAGSRPTVFIATAPIDDDPEMMRRIHRHRASRPSTWTTVEAPLNISEAIARHCPEEGLAIVDCVEAAQGGHSFCVRQVLIHYYVHKLVHADIVCSRRIGSRYDRIRNRSHQSQMRLAELIRQWNAARNATLREATAANMAKTTKNARYQSGNAGM